MIILPKDLRIKYLTFLKNNPETNPEINYQKWANNYWDFCYKKKYEKKSDKSISLFLDKMVQYNKISDEINQARSAFRLLFKIFYKEKNGR